MLEAQVIERFLADPVGFTVCLHDGSLAVVAECRGHGSRRQYRLRGRRSWVPLSAFHSVLTFAAFVSPAA